MDLLSSQTSSSLRDLRHLSLKAYPFPIFEPDRFSYTTYDFTYILPLFPGLQLDCLEVEDAFHGSEVEEDGWGHNATYSLLEGLVKRGLGWKELRFRSASDKWMEPVTFQCHQEGKITSETHGKDEQPGTWEKWIKERDGDSAEVEMHFKEIGEGTAWRRVEGTYNSRSSEQKTDYENERRTRPAVEILIRRGKGADYVQKSPEEYEWGHQIFKERFLKAFHMSWWKMKEEGLFLQGAENNPTVHL